MKTKKSLGQHFLKSKTVLSAIIDASDLQEDDIVLEIGPGEGVLTEQLIGFVKKVIAVEKDKRLIPYLKEKFAGSIEKGKLDILEKDILEFNPEILSLYKHPYKVVANIPYYITGQIFRMFLETKFQPESMTLLIQKEVAERVIAKNGKESLLSLSVKAFGRPSIVRTVGRGAFSPQPNVDSAILNIKNISQKNLNGVNSKLFFKIIHAGFAHKRKQLLSNLASLYPKEHLVAVFKKNHLDPQVRAEDLPLETWIKICNTIIK